MNVLEIKGLRKSFGDKAVLKSIDLTVPGHSIFGFIGKNGSGKTTTMKAVLGLLYPDEGEISVCGERVVFGETKTNRYIGYLPDVPEFYGHMTAREYMYLCGECLGMQKADMRERTDKLLSLVGLSDEKHRVSGYSRGMKQRLGIAQALLARPALLICDEPTSALDPVGRKEILGILQAVRTQTTVLFSTHILSDVEKICTDVAFLDHGTARVQGKLADLKMQYRREEYILETERAADADRLRQTFPYIRVDGPNRLTFCESKEDTLFQVLRFVTEQQIPLLRIERAEPTLESLFMEVTEQ
jgi:ABC-2 type transport system ATP-binding protein